MILLILFAIFISIPQAMSLNVDEVSADGMSITAEFSPQVTVEDDVASVSLENAGGYFIGGSPDAPVVSELFVCHPDADVRLSFSIVEAETIIGVRLSRTSHPTFENGELDTRFNFQEDINNFPRDAVWLNEYGIARFARVFAIRFACAKNISAGVVIFRKVKAELRFSKSLNQIQVDSRIFREMLERTSLNGYLLPSSNSQWEGVYLVIYPPDQQEWVMEWIKWRLQAGFWVYSALCPDITGSTYSSIRNYIRNLYNAILPRPDLIMIFGDVEQVPHYPFFGEDEYVSDYSYSLMDTGDFLPEMLVGRYPSQNPLETQLCFSKQRYYEADVYAGDWLLRGMCASTYLHAGSPPFNTLWVMELALRSGFTQIDTFFQHSDWEDWTQDIINSFNNGVGFSDYRGWGYSIGWWEPQFIVSDVMGLTNAWLLPVITSIVCGTGDFASGSTAFCEAWFRTGTPAQPRGGIAFYGPSDHNTHTQFNNPINCGFYHGLFEEKLHRFGECVFTSKINLLRSFPDSMDIVEQYFHTYNILGDPALRIWTCIPRTLNINVIGGELYPGHAVGLRISADGDVVHDAVVTILAEGDTIPEIYRTNEEGIVWAEIPSCTLSVLTATADQYKPRQIRISGDILSPLRFTSIDVIDTTGDNDGIIEPGESFDISVTMQNVGYEEIQSILTASFSTDECEMISPTGFTIPAGGNLTISVPCRCRWDATSTNTELLLYAETGGRPATGVFPLNSQFGAISIDTIIFVDTISGDGDGILEPGEIASAIVWITNIGFSAIDSLELCLFSGDGAIIVDDNVLSFTSPLNPATSGQSENFPAVRLSPLVENNHPGKFIIAARKWNGITPIASKIIELGGVPEPRDPTGPDKYGYVAYENGDYAIYSPEFSWKSHSEYIYDSIIVGDDRTFYVGLPFPARFYGREYDTITVCDNGWLAFGTQAYWHNDFVNQPIPTPGGPFGLVAPFWDDLDGGAGAIYTFCNNTEGWFAVEWHNLPHRTTGHHNTLQVLIFNPALHSTPSGDSPILFQYQEIHDTDYARFYATVGIEAPDKRTGIQYAFANRYAPTSNGSLSANRAILFTTEARWSRIEGAIDFSEIPQMERVLIFTSRGQIIEPGTDGRFYIVPAETGMVTITAICPGYLPAETTFNACADARSMLSLALRMAPKPENFSASKGAPVVELTWDVPEIPAGHTLTGFKILRSFILSDIGKIIADLPGDSLHWFDEQLPAGTKGFYRIVAEFDSIGISSLSMPDSGWVFLADVDEMLSLNNIKLFPNPVNQKLLISLGGFNDSDVEILDIAGRVVHCERTKKSHIQVDVSNISSGIYFVNIKSAGKNIHKRIVIIK